MSELFAGLDYTGEPFRLFGAAHLLALGLVILLNSALLYFRFYSSAAVFRSRFRRSLAMVLLVNEAAYHLWRLTTHQWTLQKMLPFHLCAVMVYLSVIMLLTRSYFLYQLLYFMGIGGALQALITPNAGIYGFPHFRAFQTFISHGAIIMAALYMTLVERYRPTWKSIWRVAIWLNLYMLGVGVINWRLGSNYMWIARKPDVATVLDWFGPWPWYILGMEAVGLGICLLLYLPFAMKDWRASRMAQRHHGNFIKNSCRSNCE
jgi:hypothetical integral membrane protein (TIGR02206 family)